MLSPTCLQGILPPRIPPSLKLSPPTISTSYPFSVPEMGVALARQDEALKGLGSFPLVTSFQIK